MGEPQDIPRYANGQVVDYTWAESGAATEPTSGRKATGLAVGDVPAPDDWNWPDQTAARFARAMFSRHVNASEGLFTSWLVPGSGVWEDGTNPLEGYLGDGGGTNNLVADVWLNPEDIDEGAVRVQVTASKASPVTFTADRDNYVFVPVDLTTPPLATAGDLTITPVVIGNPAPATPAGTVGVWKVTTDATSIVSQEVLVFDLPAFKAIQLAEDLDVDGDLTVGGTATIGGVLTVSSGGANVTGNSVFNDNLQVSGAADLRGNVNVGNAAGDVITVAGTMTCNAPVTVANGQTFTANGNAVLGNAASDQHTITGLVQVVGGGLTPTMTIGASAGSDPSLEVTGGTGPAIEAHGNVILGDTGADTLTINASIDAPVVVGVTSASPALSCTNAGTGRGISVVAADNYAGFFQSDASSPTRAALFLLPQDSDPSSSAFGDLFVSSARNKLRFGAVANYQSVHSSPKGSVRAFAMGADFLAHSGTTGEICNCQITAEEVGEVLLTMTVFWDPAADDTVLTVIIQDDTAGSNLVSRDIRAKDVDGSGDRGEAVTIRYVYTLPAAGARTFVAVLSPDATADLRNPVLSVEGVL